MEICLSELVVEAGAEGGVGPDLGVGYGEVCRVGCVGFECPQNYMLYHCTLFLCSVSVTFIDFGTMQQFPVECE